MEIKPEYEKGLFGSIKGIKGITMSDIENLKTTAIKGLEAKEQLVKLSRDYEQVKRLVPSVQERIQRGKELSRLKELETAFQRLPESAQNSFSPQRAKATRRTEGGKDKRMGNGCRRSCCPFS